MTSVNGVELHCRLDGPPGAPALVLLNSLGADLHMWDPLVPALTARHRLLRHDARGHGRSPATPGPYTVELLAQDAAALVAAAGLARPHVCGLSLGGMVAIRLAASAPGLVASLVLCNTAARMPRPEAYDARIARVLAGGLEAVVDDVLEVWFTPELRARRPEVVARAREMILGTSVEGYAAACAAVRDADLGGLLGGLTAPTLVVSGAADVATPRVSAEALLEAIPGARGLELPVAHLSALEAGPVLARHVLAFIGEVGFSWGSSDVGAAPGSGGCDGRA